MPRASSGRRRPPPSPFRSPRRGAGRSPPWPGRRTPPARRRAHPPGGEEGTVVVHAGVLPRPGQGPGGIRPWGQAYRHGPAAAVEGLGGGGAGGGVGAGEGKGLGDGDLHSVFQRALCTEVSVAGTGCGCCGGGKMDRPDRQYLAGCVRWERRRLDGWNLAHPRSGIWKGDSIEDERLLGDPRD